VLLSSSPFLLLSSSRLLLLLLLSLCPAAGNRCAVSALLCLLSPSKLK
jgi:hypothetical protein